MERTGNGHDTGEADNVTRSISMEALTTSGGWDSGSGNQQSAQRAARPSHERKLLSGQVSADTRKSEGR